MRTVFVVLAALLMGGGAQAQQNADSPISQNSDSPISLQRIREELSKPAPTLSLRLEGSSSFRTEVHEQQKLNDMMKSFDFRGGPVPAGGLYMYEQQRITNDPTNHPLAQPYAAFTGGQLLTLTSEALAERYLASRRP